MFTNLSDNIFELPWGALDPVDVTIGKKNGPGDNITTGELSSIVFGFSVKSEECKTDVDCCVNECIKLTMPLDTDNTTYNSLVLKRILLLLNIVVMERKEHMNY